MKQKKSLQNLLGYVAIKQEGLELKDRVLGGVTITPQNLSLTEGASRTALIEEFRLMLNEQPETEWYVADRREYFAPLRRYLEDRIAAEPKEAVRRLLRAERDFVESQKDGLSAARDYALLVNPKNGHGAWPGAALRDFTHADWKRILARYFGCMTEYLPENYDGEQALRRWKGNIYGQKNLTE